MIMAVEETVYSIVNCGLTFVGIGCVIGFAVIITDYVLTSILSMMKGGV